MEYLKRHRNKINLKKKLKIANKKRMVYKMRTQAMPAALGPVEVRTLPRPAVLTPWLVAQGMAHDLKYSKVEKCKGPQVANDKKDYLIYFNSRWN